MIANEIHVAPALVRTAAEAFVERGTPLGAYATASAVRYLFLEDGAIRVLAARTVAGEPVAALSEVCPGFAWDEREMADEFRIVFDRLPDARPFRPIGGELAPAIIAAGAGVTQVVVGPVHAGIIEPGRFTFSSGGETIAHLDFQIGYVHRGLERSFEGSDPRELAPRVARVCGGCSAARSLAYALAVESIAGARTSEPVADARLIVAELERIYNHLFDLAVCAAAAGFGAGQAAGLALKERTLRICRAATGHRLLFDAIVPGGVGEHVLEDREYVRGLLLALQDDVGAYTAALFDNSSLMWRFKDTGVLSPDAARALMVVGPAHRASGGLVDVRTAAPYGAYCRLPVVAAHDDAGDVLARCRVKVAELGEAFALIARAFDHLSGHALERVEIDLPEAGESATVVEGPRGAETVALTVHETRVQRVHFISASYRNWPAVAYATTAGIIPDAPLVNKSFNLCYACADR